MADNLRDACHIIYVDMFIPDQFVLLSGRVTPSIRYFIPPSPSPKLACSIVYLMVTIIYKIYSRAVSTTFLSPRK